ncbi:uncharacterized protein LOC134837458 [Culicoides brevitarsis]|uniref:uncharacterized protein LOC134837458 n=1 Tax=Culicoides brevitarsis TaxID=469753 RepID=UPI00307BDD5B
MGFRQMSLLDRKRLQWKREKDEMAKLDQIYSQQNHEMTNVRKSLQQSDDSGFTSDDLHPSSGNSGENLTNQKQILSQGQTKKPVSIDSDLGHETDFKSFCGRSMTPESIASVLSYPQSINSRGVKEERAKWNLYDPFYKDLSAKNLSDGPGWLERNMKDCETESIDSFSFVRGQNTPLDPSVLAAREMKRKKALELQDAIKQQLEEREMIKKIEREKQLMEERIEEQRLLKQLQEEQERLELEQQIQRTRQENELKKQELMRKAIEKAALEAKVDKEKRRGRNLIRTPSPSLPTDIQQTHISQEHDSISQQRQLSLDDKSKNNSEVNRTEVDADGEKILIGTPIKMKKKHLKHVRKQNLTETTEESTEDESSSALAVKKKPEKQEATDIDGISLQVQSVIPVVPMPFAQNFFGLAPQGNFGNVQLLMIAQPNAMLATQPNPFTMYPNYGMANINSMSPQPSEISQASIITKKEAAQDDQCRPDSASSELPKKETHVVPHEGTFTKEILPCDTKLDVATSTNDDLQSIDTVVEYQMRTPVRTLEEVSKKPTVEIGIQTEFDCEYCHFKFSHERTRIMCHSSVNHKNERQKFLYENGRTEEETTMTTTTTTIVKKEKKFDSIQDRPKWGVRIPKVQYQKASEKDPFYQRNRRRRYLKTSKSLDHNSKVDESSSSEAPPRTPSSHHSLLRNNKKDYYTSRNVCTELLPIKTDGNGKVYFLREKSFIINEQMRSKPGLQGVISEKILDRRQYDNQEENYHSDKNQDFDSIENSRTSSVEFN